MAVSRRPVLDFWPYQAMVRAALWPSGARRQGSVEFSGQPNRRRKTRSYSYQNNVEEIRRVHTEIRPNIYFPGTS